MFLKSIAKMFKSKIHIIQGIAALIFLFASIDLQAQLSYTLNAPAGSANCQWKKQNLTTGATTNVGMGLTYNANSVGMYYAEFDYKICRKKSDYVVLIDGCVPGSDTLVKLNSASVSGGTYQWYKNGVLLAGATNALLGITSKDTGVFHAMINAGGCMIKSEIFNVQVLRISCNYPPVASRYAINKIVGQPMAINLSSGTHDPNGDPLVFTLLGPQPANASVKIDANGNAVVVPNAVFIGSFTFSYVVCDVTTQIPNPLCDTETITVNMLNNGAAVAPVANDDRVTLPKNRTANIQVLANDFKGSGDSLIPALFTFGTPGRGSASLLLNGTVSYIPAVNFLGIDTIYYRVCNVIPPISCDSAIIVVQYTNDSISIINLPPLATDDFYSTTIGKAIELDIINNDSDPDGDSLNIPTLIVNVKNGVLTNLGNGKYVYKPDSSFAGKDTFRYRVCDYGAPVLCDTAIVVIDVPCPDLSGFGIDSLNPTACNANDGVIIIKGLVPNVFYNVSYNKDGVPQTASNIKSSEIGDLRILNLGRGTYTNFLVSVISNSLCFGTSPLTKKLVGPLPVVTGLNIFCK
jgi:hypothetical protein